MGPARRPCGGSRGGGWGVFRGGVQQRQQRLPVRPGRGHRTLDVPGRAQRDDPVVLGDRPAPAQRGEAQPLQASQHGRELVEDGGDGRVGAGGHGDTVERVVGLQRPVRVVAPQGVGEARVRLAHRVELDRAQLRDRLAHGEFVHGGGDRLRGPDGADVERAHEGVATGLRLHEPRLLQPRQRLTHRRTTDPEPLGQVTVVETLTGRERAVDDGVTDGPVGALAEERPGDETSVLRNWHAIYCMLRGVGLSRVR